MEGRDPWTEHEATLPVERLRELSEQDRKQELLQRERIMCQQECARCREECTELIETFKHTFSLRFIKLQKNLNRRRFLLNEWGVWIDKWKALDAL